MKKALLLVSVLAVFGLSLVPMKAKASHGGGGELIYEWISDSTYRFFFKFYRDCTGIPQDPSEPLCAVPSCTPSNPNIQGFTTTMQPWTGALPGGGQNGSPLSQGCAGAQYQTRCTNSNSIVPGFEEWWFSAIVTLPGQCNFWTFSVSVGARNTAVNTNNTSAGNIYLETTFNNLYFQGNSSPYFSIKPIPYVCINSPFSYNNGAIDPNGDSLVTDIVTPRVDGCGSTAANAQYASMSSGVSLPSNPFACNNTFVVNPQTGQMNFTAAAQGAQTLATRVREYRQGFLIGYIMRDVQIQVMNCSSVVPVVTPVASSILGGNYSNNH